MISRQAFAVLALSIAATGAIDSRASHERFHKDSADAKSGFLAATDPTYVKECGGCHFAYSPGLLPARSWELHMDRLNKHFGETVMPSAAARDSIRRYLVENAADRSPFEGSKEFVERVKPESTPYRLQDVAFYQGVHKSVLEAINVRPRVKVKSLTNCDACHQYAAEGSFGNSELVVPGLTRARAAR